MKLSFWSDEDRLFVQRQFGFGWSLNLKFIFKKLGLIKPPPPEQPSEGSRPQSHTERLKKQIEDSRYEERR